MKAGHAYNYPLRLDKKDGAAVAQVAKESGMSINSVLVLSIRNGLPVARQSIVRPPKRVTTVDPLPDDVLRRAYSEPDDLDGVSARQLEKFQTQREPE